LERDVVAAAPQETNMRVVTYQNMLMLAQARHEWLRRLLATLRATSHAEEAEKVPAGS
jgi:hypothetical protein